MAAAVLLGGCQADTDRPPPSPSPDDCLLLVWEEQETRDEAFDRAHDEAEGGAISCATRTSASQFEAALAAVRSAARSGDRAALIDQVAMPLLYIDDAGNRRQLARADLTGEQLDAVFDAPMIALLSHVKLSDLTVVAGEGAFAELGSVWLVAARQGGRPRIATVNRQALGEAAAARRRAPAVATER